jgi:uncharacterized protein
MPGSRAPGTGTTPRCSRAPGRRGAPFPSAHHAVNVVSDALFYVDTEVKDRKLGSPAGITPSSCGTFGVPCPQDLESPWSGHARENVVANLRGLEMVFLGEGPDPAIQGGIGFDDFLVAVGAVELAATMRADIAAAIAAAEAIPGSLGEALGAAPEAVAASHAAVKRITDNLKSQFLTVLALELPDEIGDDTD